MLHLCRGINLNCCDPSNSNTPVLHMAMDRPLVDVVQKLLTMGADPNLAGGKGECECWP